jgi:hypothetical protein
LQVADQEVGEQALIIRAARAVSAAGDKEYIELLVGFNESVDDLSG